MSERTSPDEKWYQNKWVQMTITNVLTFTFTFLTTLLLHQTPAPPVPAPVPDENVGPPVIQGAQGWVDDPVAVADAMTAIEAKQKMPAVYGAIARDAMAEADTDKAVFMFEYERKVRKQLKPSWDQGRIGTCVPHGTLRAIQDEMYYQVATGSREQIPDEDPDIATAYGGMRVQIGKGRIRGEGGIVAWQMQWAQEYGVIFKKKYLNGKYDLTQYSESLCRQYGQRGCPKDLEPEAKLHPVETVAKVANAAEIWSALGNSYAVAVGSNVGYETPRGGIPKDGIFKPNGTWGHCMYFRGRFMHPSKGKCVVVQNSWDNYLGARIKVQTVDHGEVELPEGCFAILLSDAGRMASQGDCFACSGVKGFPKRKPQPWPASRSRKRPVELFAVDPFSLSL